MPHDDLSAEIANLRDLARRLNFSFSKLANIHENVREPPSRSNVTGQPLQAVRPRIFAKEPYAVRSSYGEIHRCRICGSSYRKRLHSRQGRDTCSRGTRHCLLRYMESFISLDATLAYTELIHRILTGPYPVAHRKSVVIPPSQPGGPGRLDIPPPRDCGPEGGLSTSVRDVGPEAASNTLRMTGLGDGLEQRPGLATPGSAHVHSGTATSFSAAPEGVQSRMLLLHRYPPGNGSLGRECQQEESHSGPIRRSGMRAHFGPTRQREARVCGGGCRGGSTPPMVEGGDERLKQALEEVQLTDDRSVSKEQLAVMFQQLKLADGGSVSNEQLAVMFQQLKLAPGDQRNPDQN